MWQHILDTAWLEGNGSSGESERLTRLLVGDSPDGGEDRTGKAGAAPSCLYGLFPIRGEDEGDTGEGIAEGGDVRG